MSIRTLEKDVLIVGAGLAGLACATRLHDAGARSRIFEGGDAPGGRVRTDSVDGFLLDRGFQVYLDAYPEAGTLLDKASLDLRPFKPGALVYQDGRMYRVMDVFRDPRHLLASTFAPVGSLPDKLRVALLKWRLSRLSIGEMPRDERSPAKRPAKARPVTASKPSASLQFAVCEDPNPWRVSRTKKRPKA